jgi:hypothetical protein
MSMEQQSSSGLRLRHTHPTTCLLAPKLSYYTFNLHIYLIVFCLLSVVRQAKATDY